MIDKRLPPCNLDAEEALLGAILFDGSALAKVKDWLPAVAFFPAAHRTIYEACLHLEAKDQGVDLISLATYLTDLNKLDQIGGMVKLSQLLSRTVSASNVDRYGKLILEKYQRRELIALGAEIIELGYDQSEDLQIIQDKIQSLISQKINAASLRSIEPISAKIRYKVFSRSGRAEIEMIAKIDDLKQSSSVLQELSYNCHETAKQVWRDDLADLQNPGR